MILRYRGRAAGAVRGLAVCLLALCLAGGLCLPARAEAVGRLPCRFCFENLAGSSAGQRDQMLILSGWSFSAGETLHFSGWLAAEGGIRGYEYAFVPVGEGAIGSPEWRTPAVTAIFARSDLQAAGIPYQSGHKTAGFSLELTAPTGTDGYYDFYLRGIAADGSRCDLLVMLDTVVGQPDADDGETRRVNLSRLARDTGTLPGVSFAWDGAVTLTAGGVLPLGTFNLAAFERVTVTYTVPAAFTAEQGTRAAALGLKLSADTTAPAPYNHDPDGLYDMTGSQVLGRLRAGSGARTLELDLTGADGWGQLYLSAYLFGADSVTVTDLTFTYRGKGTTRTAARIFLSGDLASYLSDANAVTTETVQDDALGDVLRIRAASDTNDPYVYFRAESLLAEHGIRIDADEYRYVVILVRARAGNQNGNMTFYLCAGNIGGPTEDCTASRTLQTDGQWHYCLLDLSSLDTWAGIVHGWRFDMINGFAAAGDWVDYASVQFFRTEEAAKQVAAGNPNRPDTVYHSGDAPVMRDDREERGAEQDSFTPEQGDIRTPPEPDTGTATETDTAQPPEPDTSDTGRVPDPDTAGDGSGGTDTAGADTTGAAGRGCRSAVGAAGAAACLLALPVCGALSARRAAPRRAYRRAYRRASCRRHRRRNPD